MTAIPILEIYDIKLHPCFLDVKETGLSRNLRCRIFQMTVKGFSRQVMGEDILVEEKNGYNEELLVMVINKSVFRVNLSLL